MSLVFFKRENAGESHLDLSALLRPRDEEREKPEPPCRVVLHNDDVTPIEYVPGVLRRVFALSRGRAVWITLKAHAAGRAVVTVEACSKAEAHVAEAHELARHDGHSYLRFSVEPVET